MAPASRGDVLLPSGTEYTSLKKGRPMQDTEPTMQPGRLEESQEPTEAMEECISDLWEQVGEPEAEDGLDCGVDSDVLHAGLDEIGRWVRNNEHGVLGEVIQAYMGEDSRLAPEVDLTADMFRTEDDLEKLVLERELLRITLPWITSRAIGDSLIGNFERLKGEMGDAIQHGDMESARDLCHEAKRQESQGEHWWDATDRAFNRLHKALLLVLDSGDTENLPGQGR